MNPVHYSSAKQDWETPQDLFDELAKEFSFELDAAASAFNAKCPSYFDQEDNGLANDWGWSEGRVVWCNPPYGRGLGKWVAKGALEASKGATVVMLIPARTDTKYWHAYIWDHAKNQPRPGVEVRLLPGRLKFGGVSAPKPPKPKKHNGDCCQCMEKPAKKRSKKSSEKPAGAPFPSAVVIFRPS